ncbi:leucine-rich_repeat domain-containing protein [Hexamita inflata]|uniref:Leucine-rich repeat domain-containing protein n=1 Tax=Hexamita inflata TaxID=28002 RepID=A0AA86QD25_9EUKA|nr:leucine-rich repeat domain-containing protein [Hexamita inflata]
MIHLNTLYVDNNQIKDVSPLNSLTNLKILYLPDNKVSDLSQLRNLCRLEELNIGFNELTDLYGVQHLKSLKNLTVSGNRISDRSPLSECQKLEYLSIQNNQITSIAPLLKIQTLHILHPENNFITELGQSRFRLNMQQEPSEHIILLSNRMRAIYYSRINVEKNFQKKQNIQNRYFVVILEVKAKIESATEIQFTLSKNLLRIFGNLEHTSQ